MPNIGPMMTASTKLAVGYAEKLLTNIQDSDCARFARMGDTVIESNHPAFILGHLTLYPIRVISQLGADATSVTPSERFQQLFSHEATCVDDPDRITYPALDEIVSVFKLGYSMAIELLESTEDQAFFAENPLERLRARFPTIGSAHAFYVGGHMMMHLGQLSAWRRSMGLGAA